MKIMHRIRPCLISTAVLVGLAGCGGYVFDNYVAARDALDLSAHEIVTLARNSITASWANAGQKDRWHAEIDAVAAASI